MSATLDRWIERGKQEHAELLAHDAEGRRMREQRDELLAALVAAEGALADIGDAEREPGDNLAWCERRAAKALPAIRAAIARATGEGA